MEKENKIQNIFMKLCIGILILFFLTIVVRIFTRQVLIVHMGMDNAFTRLVFWDNDAMSGQETEDGNGDLYDYDWSADYPFEEGVSTVSEVKAEEDTDNSILTRYTDIVSSVEERIQNYTQDNLAGYSSFTWLGNKYKNLIGWNFASFSEYNGTFQMSDGYWTSLNEEVDQTQHAENLANFRDFCEEQDIDFLYVQFPHKISEYQDTDISGTADFTNQNADQLLELADSYGIPTLDIRENIRDSGVNNHSLFYVTDHHWKAESGLWTTGIVADYLNQNYGYSLDTSKLDIENYDIVEYKESFLGSYGTKVTTANAIPDDFSMLYPKFETNLHFTVPSMNVDETGDFSITYDMSAEGEYGAYAHGDHALIQYENLDNNAEDKKLLIIHDSFANSVLPFLATTVSEIDSIDLRYFNGSLQTYIKETTPDMVLILRYAAEIATERSIDSHSDAFDFR